MATNKRERVEVSFREKLAIARAYEKRRCNWPEILKEVKNHLEDLPATAQELYRTGAYDKLKRRMSEQMKKLLKEGTAILHQELRRIIENIKTLEGRYSLDPGTHPSVRKETAKKAPKRPLEEEIEDVVRVNIPALDPDHRNDAIPVFPETEDEEAAADVEPADEPEREPQEKPKSTKDWAKDAYMAVVKSCERGEKLDAKMERCMDKYLSSLE